MHAAHAHGFAAQWLTGWYAYDVHAARWLGIAEGERVAGFIHIGTPTVPPSARDRPDIATISSRWRATPAG
jgi:nitroreductase